MDIRERVVAILAEKALLAPDDIRPDSRLSDLGIDSLGLVEAIFAIEESFDITIPFNANDPGQAGFDITSVDTIISAVEGLVAQKAA